MKVYLNLFDRIISPENLFGAWDVFKSDKRNKPDVIRFEECLEKNLFRLHRELRDKTYRHEPYSSFYIHDPKTRHIHKATVRDRVLHHAVFSVVNPILEETFIQTSFSCRVDYGTHKGVKILEKMLNKVSKNNTRSCFALKCDVRKFFDSMDHEALISILKERIKDPAALWLLQEIIAGYVSKPERERE